MSEDDKHDTLPLQPTVEEGAERLDREPLLSVKREGSKTYISGDFDLDQLAEEADEALAKGFAKLRDSAEYDAQGALLGIVEELHERMRQLGMNEAELARRLEVSRSYISRLFNATPNLTVLSLAKWARALGGHVRINLVIDDEPAGTPGQPGQPALPPKG